MGVTEVAICIIYPLLVICTALSVIAEKYYVFLTAISIIITVILIPIYELIDIIINLNALFELKERLKISTAKVMKFDDCENDNHQIHFLFPYEDRFRTLIEGYSKSTSINMPPTEITDLICKFHGHDNMKRWHYHIIYKPAPLQSFITLPLQINTKPHSSYIQILHRDTSNKRPYKIIPTEIFGPFRHIMIPCIIWNEWIRDIWQLLHPYWIGIPIKMNVIMILF